MRVDFSVGRATGFLFLRFCWLYRDVSISFVLKYIFKVALIHVFFFSPLLGKGPGTQVSPVSLVERCPSEHSWARWAASCSHLLS